MIKKIISSLHKCLTDMTLMLEFDINHSNINKCIESTNNISDKKLLYDKKIEMLRFQRKQKCKKIETKNGNRN